MATNKFKVGDVVRLKAGGNGMTIKEMKGALFCCKWLENGKEKNDDFEESLLIKGGKISSFTSRDFGEDQSS